MCVNACIYYLGFVWSYDYIYTLDKFSKLIVHLLTGHISLTKPARHLNILTNHENNADSNILVFYFPLLKIYWQSMITYVSKFYLFVCIGMIDTL